MHSQDMPLRACECVMLQHRKSTSQARPTGTEHSAALLTADLTASLWVTLTPSSGTNAPETATLHPDTGGRSESAPGANAQPKFLLASLLAVFDAVQLLLFVKRSHTILSSRLRNSALPLYNSGTRSNTPLVFLHSRGPPLVAPAIMTNWQRFAY